MGRIFVRAALVWLLNHKNCIAHRLRRHPAQTCDVVLPLPLSLCPVPIWVSGVTIADHYAETLTLVTRFEAPFRTPRTVFPGIWSRIWNGVLIKPSADVDTLHPIGLANIISINAFVPYRLLFCRRHIIRCLSQFLSPLRPIISLSKKWRLSPTKEAVRVPNNNT
ncbi:hypothetical protein F5Y18DRAFT_116170 [Xylariaceae sp. FL1019]|nr:hypothetical protein F5Y18DRAFT_116170 [Xylariaceae sp. FL1019]